MFRSLSLSWLLNLCGGVYIFTALANQGWIPYIKGIVVGGYGFEAACIQFVYYFVLFGVSAILLSKAIHQLAKHHKEASIRKLAASVVFMGIGIASLFAPSRAELSFWVWHDDFKAIVQSSMTGNPIYLPAILPITHERPWRFGETVTISDTASSWSFRPGNPPKQTSDPEHVLVFDYGYAVASLVFNSTDQAISHEFSGLCMTDTSEGGFIKRLEKNWFLCQRLGPK